MITDIKIVIFLLLLSPSFLLCHEHFKEEWNMDHEFPECGRVHLRDGSTRRIVGGVTTTAHQYPWLVALYYHYNLHCGGSVITHRHVVTAGHCLAVGKNRTKANLKDMDVLLGLYDRESDDYSIHKIMKGYLHPNFTTLDERDENDIAVVKLKQRFTFNSHVSPICLPHKDLVFDESILTVAGWGRNEARGGNTRFSKEAKLKIIPNDRCMEKDVYQKYLVPKTMFCAYQHKSDACQGDSGGPLFGSSSDHKQDSAKPGKQYLVGIVSWGIGCAKEDYPGVFTRVQAFLPWIKKIVRMELSPDSAKTNSTTISATENYEVNTTPSPDIDSDYEEEEEGDGKNGDKNEENDNGEKNNGEKNTGEDDNEVDKNVEEDNGEKNTGEDDNGVDKNVEEDNGKKNNGEEDSEEEDNEEEDSKEDNNVEKKN